MEIKDQIIVVTGAASGIGKSLVARFTAEGAKAIVAADLNEEGAKATAEEYGCIAMSANVAREEDIKRLIDDVESQVGPIDLFCSNAGVALAPDLNASNEHWQASWDINVMSHLYAARHLVPKMVARGGGYFLNTASAAGLLNQIGGAAYGVTKHAAVGFAEWLAMHHAHEGIKVSVLCPQAVRTAMTTTADGVKDDTGAAAAANDGMMEPEELAECVVKGLADESFLILPHAEVLEYMRRKTSDYDRWIGGMNRLYLKLTGRG